MVGAWGDGMGQAVAAEGNREGKRRRCAQGGMARRLQGAWFPAIPHSVPSGLVSGQPNLLMTRAPNHQHAWPSAPCPELPAPRTPTPAKLAQDSPGERLATSRRAEESEEAATKAVDGCQVAGSAKSPTPPLLDLP